MDGGITVVVWDPRARPLRSLLIAYMRAVERIRHESNAIQFNESQVAAEQAAWIAAVEALNWLDSIDHFLSKRSAASENQELSTLLDAAPIWSGLQHARNVSHHEWLLVQATSIKASTEGHHKTLMFADLPEVEYRRESRSYLHHLQGKPVIEILDLCTQLIWPFRRWAICHEDIAQPGVTHHPPVALDQSV